MDFDGLCGVEYLEMMQSSHSLPGVFFIFLMKEEND